jgi:hypothetical protein
LLRQYQPIRCEDGVDVASDDVDEFGDIIIFQMAA